MSDDLELVTLEEAARIVGKTPHNIRDYIQRVRIAKYSPDGEKITRASSGQLRVSLKELRIFLALIEQGLEKHHHAGLHKNIARRPPAFTRGRNCYPHSPDCREQSWRHNNSSHSFPLSLVSREYLWHNTLDKQRLSKRRARW